MRQVPASYHPGNRPSEYRRYRAEPPPIAYCPACLQQVRQEHQAIMQQLVERGSCCTCRASSQLARTKNRQGGEHTMISSPLSLGDGPVIRLH